MKIAGNCYFFQQIELFEFFAHFLLIFLWKTEFFYISLPLNPWFCVFQLENLTIFLILDIDTEIFLLFSTLISVKISEVFQIFTWKIAFFSFQKIRIFLFNLWKIYFFRKKRWVSVLRIAVFSHFFGIFNEIFTYLQFFIPAFTRFLG